MVSSMKCMQVWYIVRKTDYKSPSTWCNFCWTSMMFMNIHGNRNMLDEHLPNIHLCWWCFWWCWMDVHMVRFCWPTCFNKNPPLLFITKVWLCKQGLMHTVTVLIQWIWHTTHSLPGLLVFVVSYCVNCCGIGNLCYFIDCICLFFSEQCRHNC